MNPSEQEELNAVHAYLRENSEVEIERAPKIERVFNAGRASLACLEMSEETWDELTEILAAMESELLEGGN